METKSKEISHPNQRIDPVKSTIEIYNKNADQFIAKWDKLFLNKEYEFFKKHLDVGCGHGRDAERFYIENYDVIGIDLSESLLEHAIKRAPGARFFKRDMRKLQFPPNCFDGIWCNSSLHHIPKNEVEETLVGFARVLKYTGIMFITVKAGENEAVDGAGRFYSYYKEDELKKMLESIRITNIRVIDIEKVLSNNEEWINAFAMKVY